MTHGRWNSWLIKTHQCRSFRTFNVLDGFNHKGLGIEVDVSLPLEHVTRMLRTELSNGVANPGRFVVITDQKISVPTRKLPRQVDIVR